MKIIKPYHEIIDPIDGEAILRKIELCGRTCYKSEDRITEDSAKKFVAGIIRSGHHSVIEHVNITVRFVCDRGISHEIVRHRLASYCLSGDTVVQAFRKNDAKASSNKKWTVKQLFEWTSDLKRKGRIELIRLRSVNDEKIIVPGKIKSIVYSGEQETFSVITKSGRALRVTKNHRILTPDGFKQLSELSVGDRVVSNGLSALDNKEWIEDHYIRQNKTRKEVAKLVGCCEATLFKAFKRHGIFKAWSDRPNPHPGYGKKGMFSDAQKKEISERMLGEKNHAWKGNDVGNIGGRLRANKMYKPDICWGCDKTEALERHHVDENPSNNSSENIMFLCQKCHKAFHQGQGVLTVFSDEIIGIESFGIEPTYDVEMESEPHNFVANGIVVHNSQESTRYCRYTGDKFGNQITVILPVGFDEKLIGNWEKNQHIFYGEGFPYESTDKFSGMDWVREIPDEQLHWWRGVIDAETRYFKMVSAGSKPEIARNVLPNSLKTEVVMTCNLREWKWIFRQRCQKAAHPQIREIMLPLLKELHEKIPVVFDEEYEMFGGEKNEP